MTHDASTTGTNRLASLDVLRGVTIAGMILVNNPGDHANRYAPLTHAQWHGWTPTDLIFPTFIFIMGVVLTLSFERRLARGATRPDILAQVIRRSAIIFMLGLVLYGFPDGRLIGPYVLAIAGLMFQSAETSSEARDGSHRVRDFLAWGLIGLAAVYWIADFRYFQQPHPPATSSDGALRIPGVLQRIAVCYFFASLIALFCRVRGQVLCALVLLAGYWWIVKHVPSPVSYASTLAQRPEGWLHEWIDTRLLGIHLYRERPDPEGLLSTLPAIATTVIGVLTGRWLSTQRDGKDKAGALFIMANVLIVAGLWANHAIPINKKIWTSSYALFAAGASMSALATCYWLVDLRGYRRWTRPFEVFGTNPILAYVASSLLGTLLYVRSIEPSGGTSIPLRVSIYREYFLSWASPLNASLAFAFAYVVFWLVLLTPLYRRRMFIRI